MASALALTAEGLMGYWDGSVPVPADSRADDLTRLMRLDPFPRAVVLAQEGGRLFSVVPKAAAHVLRGEDELLTLQRPGPQKIAEQMAEVRTAMDLRADRLPEILAQQGDLLRFFAAQQPLGFDRKRMSNGLIAAMHDTVVAQEQRIKHFCSVLRPCDLSPQIQPVIATPGHSAYPSGHATEAFALATLIAALRLSGQGTPDAGLVDALLTHLTPVAEAAPDVDATVLLYRLAARIADNRTVAGLHFPVDSAHGALLGLSLGLGFVAHCLGGGGTFPVPEFSARGDDWQGDFTLAKWCAHLGLGTGTGWKRDSGTVAAAQDWSVLPQLWRAAVTEWGPGPAA
ncbi:phosphatase PAP2 family protein [Rhodobacter sp. Har01]|uniref:phosphatase PAP2 family protein n=1 Tax=Rhodobacter sp. Har01 TaxID=2883999 RepID=UPI001D085D0C|nr:phosphatase PAP2 family protein [Rhodobacter sp. Har01]MCB6177819.1 phosphatase PAP2 family protein [Rhodobacter sp. Har01]